MFTAEMLMFIKCFLNLEFCYSTSFKKL